MSQRGKSDSPEHGGPPRLLSTPAGRLQLDTRTAPDDLDRIITLDVERREDGGVNLIAHADAPLEIVWRLEPWQTEYLAGWLAGVRRVP